MAADWKTRTFKAGLGALYYSGLHRAMSPWVEGAGVIFMLHRVLPERSDAFQPNRHLEITPEFLRAVVDRVRQLDLDVVDLDEARRRLISGGPAKRFAAFTFDDGYRDNLELAQPILNALDVPFTIYVASGMIDRTTELWWLALEQIIGTHDQIEIDFPGRREVVDCSSVDARMRAFRTLADQLTDLSEAQQRSQIRALADRYDFDLEGLCADVAMTWDQVREIDGDPSVTIGAHTHDHYAVARLTPDAARADIERGLERLAAETGKTARHFAYPYGYHSAAAARDFEMTRDMGFATAVTTRPGVLFADHRDHLTALPRVSLNGHYQDLRYLDLFLTGAPFAIFNRFQRVNAA